MRTLSGIVELVHKSLDKKGISYEPMLQQLTLQWADMKSAMNETPNTAVA